MHVSMSTVAQRVKRKKKALPFARIGTTRCDPTENSSMCTRPGGRYPLVSPGEMVQTLQRGNYIQEHWIVGILKITSSLLLLRQIQISTLCLLTLTRNCCRNCETPACPLQFYEAQPCGVMEQPRKPPLLQINSLFFQSYHLLTSSYNFVSAH